MISYTTASEEDGVSSLSVPLTFEPGSASGFEVCASITADSDDLVESDEYFSIALEMVTADGTSFHLGNTETVVTITDSDGK